MNVKQFEGEINKAIDDIANKIFATAAKDADKVTKRVDGVRKEMNSILLEYSNRDGKIPEYRLNTLLRELKRIEEGIDYEISESLDEMVERLADESAKQIIAVIASTIGVDAFADGKRPKSDEIAREVESFIREREIDGIAVERRIKAISGMLRDSVQQELRRGVIIGATATVISLRVKKAVDRAMWQVKRIITSELPTAFRKTIAIVGGKLGIIKAVKIIDNRGRHKYHETHRCYKLAEQNMYGWGKGVYRVEDTFIYDPHPQCSAYFHYIFKDSELSKEG